jgi:hypothetical protein
VGSHFEFRLRRQLSLKALELPEKPNELGKVRSTARRRLVLSRAALSVAVLVGVVGLIGLASVALRGPADPTYAVGQPGAAADADGAEVDGSNTLLVENADATSSTAQTTAGAAAATAAEPAQNAASAASFGGECLPAPPLADVSVTDPGKQVVRVSNETELQAAMQTLSANTVLLLAPGTYELSRTLWVSVDDVTIRGDSTRCDEVIVAGKGMENPAGKDDVPHGVWSDRRNLKVQNLTIQEVYFHAITVNGGGYAPEIYNVRLLDAGEQFIKINPIGYGEGVDDGVVDYAVIKYTDAAPTADHGGGTGYTQGVDIHAGKGWTISNSRFENLHTPDSADHLWGPAVLAWNGAANTTVDGNVFVDVNRAIAFGLDGSRANDHSGGIIRNNMIVMSPGLFSDSRVAQSDAPIIVWGSPGTKVLHNTVVAQGNMAKSIELRFHSDGAEIRNNLVDAPITDRDNSNYVDAGNVSVEDTSMFRNPAIGDLHLTARAEVFSTTAHGDAAYDFDGQQRSEATDAGADEFTAEPAPAAVPTSDPTTTPHTCAPTEEDPADDPGTTTAPTAVPAPKSSVVEPRVVQPSVVKPGVVKPGVPDRPGTTTTTVTRPKPSPSTPPNTAPSTPDPTPEQPSTPAGSGDLVNKADLTYEGSFRVPAPSGNDERGTLAYGGAGLGYNEANDSLFITGHSWHQLTAEISVPEPGRSADPASLPRASFLQPLQDVTDGKLPSVSQPRTESYGRIGGYLVDGDDLIVSAYNYYDASDSQKSSHLLTDVDMGRSSNMVALTDSVKPRWLGGAMAVIPSNWQNSFGGDTYIGGLAGISIVSNSSVGPAAATFSKASLTGGDPAKLVLGYPLAEPLDQPTEQSDLWNQSSEVRGMVFPEGTSSVLYFGTHGVGSYCYGTGAECGDPVSEYKGNHAYPYRYQIWAYDAADLAKVYRGGAAAKSLKPYDYWELELPYSPRQTEIGGVAYDPSTGRIFISQGFADGTQPVIHVYTLW